MDADMGMVQGFPEEIPFEFVTGPAISKLGR